MSGIALEQQVKPVFKERVYRVLEGTGELSRPAFYVRTLIVVLILLNTLAVILDSVEAIRRRLDWYLGTFEWISVGIFTIEYLGRMWSITQDPVYRRPVVGRLRYSATPLALIDLLAIAPAYLCVGVASQLLTLRTLRLIRVFRLFKLAHYSAAMRSLGGALASKRQEMTVMLFVLAILLVIASSLMYYIENVAQPEHFSSIPAAMWWGVATVTTVGYGDVYPVTPLGKLIGAVVALLGAGLFAMPAAIWGAAFVERIIARRSEPSRCPHCGREIGGGGEGSAG